MLARLAVTSSPAAGSHGNLYLNRRLGVAFDCPPAWEFVRLDEMGEIQKGQLLATDDIDHNKTVLGSLDLPFVALSPRSTPHTCAQMYLASPPDENEVVHELMKEVFNSPNAVSADMAFAGPMRFIRRDWQILRELLKAFTVTQLPVEISISNCLAAEYTANYEFEHEQFGGGSRPVTVRSVAIEHSSRYYLLRLINDVSSSHNFSRFVDSICLI